MSESYEHMAGKEQPAHIGSQSSSPSKEPGPTGKENNLPHNDVRFFFQHYDQYFDKE